MCFILSTKQKRSEPSTNSTKLTRFEPSIEKER